MTGRNRYSAAMLLGLVAGVIGCGGGGVAGDGGDAVVVDVGLSDGEAGEIVGDAAVDGTDSVTDVIADIADVVDVVDAPDLADIPWWDDLPYWQLHDIDVAGLGVITKDDGFCSNISLKVKPNDPPQPPACPSACPAPYPCTCGACPWIETPQMQVARERAAVLWTGDEVLVFGGEIVGSFSAERWKPIGTKGFELIDLPASVTSGVGPVDRVHAFWTGNEALVITDAHQFLLNPKTNVVTLLDLAPAVLGYNGTPIWTADTLFWWGWDRAAFDIGKGKARLITWRKDTGWQDATFPAEFIQTTAAEPHCMTALDGDIYVFDPINPRNAASGLDAKLPILLRYSLATKNWAALPQTMLPNVRCINDANILFAGFDDGIAFIPVIATGAAADKYPAVGEIWWKATGKWTAMQPPPVIGPHQSAPFGVWTGKRFVISEVTFMDPVTQPAGGPQPQTQNYPSWPVTYDPYTDTFGYTTSIGFPKPQRFVPARLFTGTELFVLGGENGTFSNTFHKDGVRLWLPNP